jgi:Zn-dependent protease with chaperone function
VDFFDHQDQARKQTVILIGYFVIAVAIVVLAVYAAAVGILQLIQLTESRSSSAEFDPAFAQPSLWQPDLFFLVSGAVVTVILAGSLHKIWSLGSDGNSVAAGLGGHQVPSNTQDHAERVLLNVVEEMALASGIPVPPVYLLEDEAGINAFAAGTTPQNAVIGITRGALMTFTRDELQGVVAHEFSHILNGDMRLNIRLMGWLHGILALAIIGQTIIRSLIDSSGNNSSDRDSSSKDKGSGTIIFFMAGLALLIIGYIGVFFANLIKSSVSRQREFLADASAVQFTRNPDGIASALKKIGGWTRESKLQSPRAAEVSHMFFSNAIGSTLFATHPPLLTRVQRIDPNFVGPFSETSALDDSLSDFSGTDDKLQQRSSLAQAHTAALNGAAQLTNQPSMLSESAGQPRTEHIRHVHGLVDHLETALDDDVRDPLGAVAVIYGLLLAVPGSDLRETQLAQLDQMSDQRPGQELARVLPAIDRLSPEQRLPVVCLALPALHQMSPHQITEFSRSVRKLIRSDQTVTPFEYAVQRFIANRILPRLQSEPGTPIGHANFSKMQPAFVIVLSTLAHAAGKEQAAAAFNAGIRQLGMNASPMAILPQNQCKLQTLDMALDRLPNAAPSVKSRMLVAFTACVAVDRHVTIEEAEILRVIADTLGCPVPPILTNEVKASPEQLSTSSD